MPSNNVAPVYVCTWAGIENVGKYPGRPVTVNTFAATDTVAVTREYRKSIPVAVTFTPLVPEAAPVIRARTVCPGSRSLPLWKPMCGETACVDRIPVSIPYVADGSIVKQTPLPKPDVVSGEPLVKITLSLRIIPKLAEPLQLLG